MHNNILQQHRAWISVATGDFTVTECDRKLGIVTSLDKASRRKAFQRMAEEGLIARITGKCGSSTLCQLMLDKQYVVRVNYKLRRRIK